jgi:hypothetical protein
MSETQPKDLDTHSTAPHDEDDEIIELVDEIPKESVQRPVPNFERQLADLEQPEPAQDQSDSDLLDIEDLLRLDFGETGGAKNEMETLIPEDAASEADDGLELIDAEEDETDNEIVWFDDLEKEIGLPKTEAETSLPESAAPDTVTESGLEAFLSEGSFSSGAGAALSGAGIAAAASAARQRSLPPATGDSSPADPGVPPPASPVFSEAEIEAAVERIIERKLGRTIESIIRQAIENAVSKEIERLKRLLLEDDHGTAP